MDRGALDDEDQRFQSLHNFSRPEQDATAMSNRPDVTRAALGGSQKNGFILDAFRNAQGRLPAYKSSFLDKVMSYSVIETSVYKGES